MEANIEKKQEMFTKDLEKLNNNNKKKKKKQAEMDNILEGINSRITEAEEEINDPEDRMVEITAIEQNIGTEWKEMKTV